MAQQKINSKVVSMAVECSQVIDKELTLLIAEFGALDLLKPAESYLLGLARSTQAQCNYLAGFANDLDKKMNQRTVQSKPLNPQQPEE